MRSIESLTFQFQTLIASTSQRQRLYDFKQLFKSYVYLYFHEVNLRIFIRQFAAKEGEVHRLNLRNDLFYYFTGYIC